MYDIFISFVFIFTFERFFRPLGLLLASFAGGSALARVGGDKNTPQVIIYCCSSTFKKI